MSATVEPVSADTHTIYAPRELAHMQSVIDAVCFELGVKAHDTSRREAIADRIMVAYSRGSRLPLNMVSAGLSEHTAA